MTPIRVLQICDSLGAGGAERLILSLAQHLDRTQVELHVCSLGFANRNQLQPDFERLGVPLFLMKDGPVYDPRRYAQIARYIRSRQIDIVHTHLIAADIMGRTVGRALGRPVVSTMHNDPQDYDRSSPKRKLLEHVTAHRLTTRLIAVSPRIREMYIAQWGLRPDQIVTIFNGVPMEQYLPIPAAAPRRAAGTGPLITNIARLSEQKAQHILLDAAKIVLGQHPEARFMIVGRGHLEERLRRQAEELGIAARVEFTGVRHDIPEILAQSDIFALSSLWEGMPVTAIEAMAAARPVVVTDVGGTRDLVEHGEHGLIVPPRDALALAEALLELLNDEPRRVAMGRAGRERVQHECSLPIFASRHTQLYESLLRAEASSAPGGVESPDRVHALTKGAQRYDQP
jgi:glycosyltransferase involved in cell wall biosynthesis